MRTAQGCWPTGPDAREGASKGSYGPTHEPAAQGGPPPYLYKAEGLCRLCADHGCRLCVAPCRPIFKCMPQQQFSPEARDLFGVIQPPASRRSAPMRQAPNQSGSVPKLSSFSDPELANLLSDLVNELQRRVPSRTELGTRPDLQRVVQDASSTLGRLAPRGPERMKRGADRESHEIVPTKRKAIRAALLSGVKPVQVAKHFGVSLTTVRQISTGQR
jgi:hypothetical protein